jgi:hypothetical protein
MAVLSAHGIEAPLPPGFEGRIVIRPTIGREVPYPVANFSTFALPVDLGDFGSGAVSVMGPSDIFATLFEYGPESLGQALFARQGMPRSLTAADFRPYVLRRGLNGQSGSQWFFTEAGRPFTLYVVLGSHIRRSLLVPRVNDLIGAVSIVPNPAATPPTPLTTLTSQDPPTPFAATPTGARWN